VQADVRAVGASVVTSEAFARQVVESRHAPGPGFAQEAGMSDEEVEEWMRLFRENKR
jgi:hypothetical protein